MQICEYLETEEACLKQELLAQPNSIYTEITAGAEAKGVIANRLQNVVITLDKVKMFLRHPGQPQGPPLRPLTDSEVVDHLWGGIKSVAKKLMKGATGLLWVHTSTRNIVGARTEAELEAAVASAMEKADELPAQLKRILEFVMQPAVDAADARKKLFELVEILREVDNERGGGLTAAADCVYLYASTKHWLTGTFVWLLVLLEGSFCFGSLKCLYGLFLLRIEFFNGWVLGSYYWFRLVYSTLS